MAYTTIDDPSQYFQTDLHTGDGSGSTETFDGNSDLQPDFLWYKSRSVAGDHGWVDTSRSKPSSNSSFFILRSNSTGGDVTVNSGSDFTAMNSDGYTYGSVHYLDLATNNSQNCVWGWKANGGTTTSTSASGSTSDDTDIIASIRQTNTTAGFSIITYTGDSTSGKKVTHGLGATPEFIIIRNRDNSSEPWAVFTTPTGIKALALNTTAAQATDSGYWSNTNPDSTHFTVGSHGSTGAAAAFVAYAFTGIQGYSKFGSYEGNNNADGPFVYTGFKPAWTMIKSIDDTYNWVIQDRERFGGINSGATDQNLAANSTSASPSSASFSGNEIDYLSNGFKIRSNAGNTNAAQTYIYMAFAHHPFVSSKGVPTTAV